MNSVSSGGRCVCPGFASGSRCPPKGQTCGVAPGTLPNYYKQIRSDPTWRSIAECRNASLSPPCYAWCASLCEADTACMTFAFHDKGGPQCELYNVTNATRGGGWVRRQQRAQYSQRAESMCMRAALAPARARAPLPSLSCCATCAPLSFAARVRGWLLQQGRARRRRQLLRWRTGPRSVAVANSSAAAGTGTRHQLQSQREPARDVPERQAVPEVWQSVLPLPSQVRVCAMSESIDSIGSYHHPYIRSVHSCCTAHPHLSL